MKLIDRKLYVEVGRLCKEDFEVQRFYVEVETNHPIFSEQVVQEKRH